MDTYRTLSTVKIVAAVFLIGSSLVAYDLFFTNHASAVDSTDSAATSTLPAIVATVENINLDSDSAIFTNSTFTSLKDFSVTLSPEPVGKDNPFSPSSSFTQSVPQKTSSKK